MNILITGGAGFIGTQLADRLYEMGHEVFIIDLPNKFTKYHLEKYNCYNVDIRNYIEFEKIKSELSFDIIYHLAAQTSGRVSQEEPELDIDTNAKGTLNIIRFAKEKRIKKVIFTSSMASYGNYSGRISENIEQRPISNYGITKVCGELFVKSLEQYGINYSIFRLFNVYGPGQDLKNMKQGMVSIYLAQLINNEEIKVTGSLERYRDFVYISDVIEALVLGLEDKTNNSTYNVGTGVKTTVETLIKTMLSIANKNLRIVEVESHEGDQFGIISDNTKLEKIGWKCLVTLENGLENLIKIEMLRE